MRGQSYRFVVGSSLGLAAVLMTGCSSTPEAAGGPPVLALTRAEYPGVFDAAVNLVAEEGMPAELRDRDGGVIETRPVVSGSLLEPWDWAGGSAGAALESTLAYQRRKARFEFVPAGFRPTIGSENDPLTGRRGVGAENPSTAVNLATYDGPIELRVWVYVERAFTPNLQRSPWTFTQTSFARDPLANAPVGDGTTRDRSIWTPIDRDEVMEEAMLKKLRARLAG